MKILVLLAAHLIAITIFLNGFLLTRPSLPHVATYEASSCLPPRYSRVLLLIVDALRSDFPLPVREETPSKFYHNQFKFVQHLLLDSPNAVYFHAQADAPTTTAQRVKAIATGGLPTMLDLGSAFSMNEISEDSILHQIRRAGGNMTLLGDDTWLSACPTCFTRAFAEPSFNVRDLHSVDNAIKSRLFSEMARDDWTLLVAHFLGVDHCGHVFGPDTSVMADKLREMDDVIRDVVGSLPDDTLLVVMGDHGMTEQVCRVVCWVPDCDGCDVRVVLAVMILCCISWPAN